MSNPNQVYQSDSLNTFSGSQNELDLRQELYNTFYGSSIEVPKSSKGLLRKIRLDNKGKPINCPCVDRVTGEQDKDYWCPICMSERYLWDEILIDFYKVQHAEDNSLKSEKFGLMNVHTGVFYIRYTDSIGDYDKLIEINLNEEGNLKYPVQRTGIWQITEIVPLRLDRGRLEFYKVFARDEDVKYLKAP